MDIEYVKQVNFQYRELMVDRLGKKRRETEKRSRKETKGQRPHFCIEPLSTKAVVGWKENSVAKPPAMPERLWQNE